MKTLALWNVRAGLAAGIDGGWNTRTHFLRLH